MAPKSKFVDDTTISRLEKVRTAAAITLKPTKYLKKQIQVNNKSVDLKLRDYQTQMIYHLLVMKRFVVGDDTGLGKCVHIHNKILTNKGWKSYADIKPKDDMKPGDYSPLAEPLSVIIGGEKHPIKNFYYAGTHPTKIVTTDLGQRIEATHVHPLLVKTERGHEWVKMQDLKVGDYLCVDRNIDLQDQEDVLLDNTIDPTLPNILTPDLARWLGYYNAIGALINSNCVEFRVQHISPLLKSEIVILSQKLFPNIECEETANSVFLYSSSLRAFLQDNGFVYDNTSTFIKPPAFIFKATRDCKQVYLQSIIDAAFVRDELLIVRHEAILKDFQLLFFQLGIPTKITPIPHYWKLSLPDFSAIDLQANTKLGYYYTQIVNIEDGMSEVCDIEVDSPQHAYVAEGLVSHNTLISIASVCYLWEKEPDVIPIIVTTKSAVYQWASEIEKFCIPDLKPVVVDGNPTVRTKIIEDFFRASSGKFLVTSYNRLKLDRMPLFQGLQGKKYLLILDEASAFKNPEAQNHEVVKAFAMSADRVWGLTATLLKNRLDEGYGIYKVVYPHLFTSRAAFLKNFCIIRKQPVPGRAGMIDVIVGHSKAHIDKFRELIWPFFLGRAKHDVAKELPVLTRLEVPVRMEKKQWDIYREAVQGVLQIPKKNPTPEVDKDSPGEMPVETTKLATLIYTQEVANSPALLGKDELVDYTNFGISAKEQALLDLLDTTEGELKDDKVIVFTRFRGQVDRLEELLKGEGWKTGIQPSTHQRGKFQPVTPVADQSYFLRVTGSDSSAERDASRQAFQENPQAKVIFLTLAGSESLNLQQASHFVFFDLPWSAGDYLQLIGRMIRIGSPHERVSCTHLLASGPKGEKTMDHYVQDVLLKKMDLIEKVLGSRLKLEGSSTEDENDVMISTRTEVDDIFDALKATKA